MVIASGRAYLLVPENCLANGECRSQALASSAVTSDVWTTKPLRLPVGEAIQPVGLAVFGSKVWTIAIGAAGGAVLSSGRPCLARSPRLEDDGKEAI